MSYWRILLAVFLCLGSPFTLLVVSLYHPGDIRWNVPVFLVCLVASLFGLALAQDSTKDANRNPPRSDT